MNMNLVRGVKSAVQLQFVQSSYTDAVRAGYCHAIFLSQRASAQEVMGLMKAK